MSLLHAIAVDLGTYVVAMGVFAAIVCYRANPYRAVNRLMAGLLATIAVWQGFVVLARTTLHPGFWGPLCLPWGVLIVLQIFLIHDACVDPRARLRRRLARARLAWLTVAGFAVGSVFALAVNVAPGLYPFSLRVCAVLPLLIGFTELRQQRRQAKAVNAYELLLFQVTAVNFTLVFAIFVLNRTPLGSRLNTAFTFIYLCIVIGLLFSERVFDTDGTARLVLRYLVRFTLHLALLLGVVGMFEALAPDHVDHFWDVALLVAVAVYPVRLACNWITARSIQSKAARAAASTREAAMEILGSADSERELVERLEQLARRYLGGIDATLLIAAVPESPPGRDPRSLLTAKVGHGWLSPDTAVREFRGLELDQVLSWFSETRLGAVATYSGRQVSATLFVGERSAPIEVITGRELRLLHELTMIAATGVERLRAVADGFRTQALAMVGGMLADLSQSARARLASIHHLVELVKDGREAELTPAYRQKAYEDAVAVATHHNMALEITRVGGGRIAVRRLSLASFIDALAAKHAHTVTQLGGRLDTQIGDPPLWVAADEQLLRQVLLNLLRNAVEACVAAKVTPHVQLRAWSELDVVHIDVIDNGPGIPPAVHDRLFGGQPEKAFEGLRLGLSFAQQAMRSIGGNITYLTPRGVRHARFRVDVKRSLREQANDRETTPTAAGPP